MPIYIGKQPLSLFKMRLPCQRADMNYRSLTYGPVIF